MEGESCPRTWQVQTKPAAGASAHTAGRAGRRQADMGNCEAGTGERVQDKTGGSCKITGNTMLTVLTYATAILWHPAAGSNCCSTGVYLSLCRILHNVNFFKNLCSKTLGLPTLFLETATLFFVSC